MGERGNGWRVTFGGGIALSWGFGLVWGCLLVVALIHLDATVFIYIVDVCKRQIVELTVGGITFCI